MISGIRSARPATHCRSSAVASSTRDRSSRIRTMRDARTAGALVRPATRTTNDKVRRVAAVLGRQLVQLAKFAEIGQLATGIIHEINGPVASLRANVSLLTEYFQRLVSLMLDGGRVPGAANNRGTGPREARGEIDRLSGAIDEVLEDLAEGTELLVSMSRNLKSLAYSAEETQEETDLHECIEVALRVARHELRHGVRVDKDFGALPRLMAYPGLLVQVFLNLFVNAAQAIEGEGVIRIHTRCDGAEILVVVSDTGGGIAPEHLARVFHPFFTTKPRGVGLGLGLPICKQIIERHGGRIDAGSSPGQGTVFRIFLPPAERGCSHGT